MDETPDMIYGVPVSRVKELCLAELEKRCIILPSKVDEKVDSINKLLDIKLYDWQIAYIFGDSDYLKPGRATGKTLTHVIKVLLSEGEPIHLYKGEYVDMIPNSRYIYWYQGFVKDIYYKLNRPGMPFKLRKVYFSRQEYINDKERGV